MPPPRELGPPEPRGSSALAAACSMSSMVAHLPTGPGVQREEQQRSSQPREAGRRRWTGGCTGAAAGWTAGGSRSSDTISSCPCCSAIDSAEYPWQSGDASAPAASSARTQSACPSIAAMNSAVRPSSVRALIAAAAPAPSSRSRSAAPCPAWAAMCSAVSPWAAVAPTLAPCASSSLMTSVCPSCSAM